MPTDNQIINQGIIEVSELKKRINEGQPGLIILDASFALPGTGVEPAQEFMKEHIQGAQFFDIDVIADHNNPLPHMLPSAGEFEEAAKALHINNDSLVVIYGQSGMVMGSARAWWMFRYFGHDNVVVLNGGLPQWKSAGYKTVSGKSEISGTQKSSFEANVNAALLKDKAQVREAIGKDDYIILDARSPARFSGQEPEPRVGLKSGHIQGSKNIPASSLINSDDGRLKNANSLQDILENHGFAKNSHKNIITTCGSGVTACMIALALFHTGSKNAAVYDGSWSEWGLL
jgi:thiosulfate/3-mercaptopyruvate sulfurtransferase